MGYVLRINHATGEGSNRDAGALARALSKRVDGEVRFDAAARALYATDASNYRQKPLGIVLPRSVEAIVATFEICRAFAAPIVMRGGGTSLAGQGCNTAVLIDTSKYLNRVTSLDPQTRVAEVQPGCILDNLRAAAEAHGLTFGPDPATHDHNTLGGMIGNNSCGVHSIMSGRTSDNVQSLEIVTYDGVRMEVGPTGEEEMRQHRAAGGRRAQIFEQLDAFRHRYRGLILAKYPDLPRRVSGYENLEQLFPEHGFNVARALVGTEGTCVTVLGAKVKLVPSPPYRTLVLIGFADVYAAADSVPKMLEFEPMALEGMDRMLVEFMQEKHLHDRDAEILPRGDGWLIAEFGAGAAAEASEAAQKLAAYCERRGAAAKLVCDPIMQGRIWALREAALGATAHVPGGPETYPGWEDSAVPRAKLGAYLRELNALMRRYNYDASFYGHFGDGLVHCRLPFDFKSKDGVRLWLDFLDEAADLVVSYGGSLSGEHGDGQARGALLEKMYGPDLVRAFGEFKAIWDPQGRMNPGKVIDPAPIASHLRIGPDDHRPAPPTYFTFGDDGHSFVKAANRCVGVGACRRRDSEKGVMCPSYMATNEEKHSTRGRARLLFEMLRDGPSDNLWQSAAVEDALSLCLSCKGCKSDCPVNVDMATYKAEFRAHYYAGRLRPRAAYTMGLIYEWSRLAAAAPWMANVILSQPLTKQLAAIAPRRRMPRYAHQTFTRWHRRRAPRHAGERIILWPDTFNNHFRPQTAIAATLVLEGHGYVVDIPQRSLCCGRPLYDWGMLDRAKMRWREILDALARDIAAGTPIIGLEPACVSAFRDELPALFPDNARARRLSKQMVFFSEFLEQRCPASGPTITGAALVQIHCHHHAVIKTDAELKLLANTGLDSTVLKSGCCGMAGSFGFERDKYAVSVAAAERALLPAVRDAPAGSLILADGFSCREQIEQGTGRVTLHLAEVLASALPREGAPIC